MEDMIYLDGFSGYGGFHLALENAGFKFSQCYFSEMDKHAIANYSYNFPNSIYAGLIQHINRTTIPHIDLFSFGWPCQDNSIAGKRKGQSGGTRSGLLYEAVRILHEYRPRHFVAENVTGLLSVNKGIDYIEAIKILAYLGESCPQYDIEMQLLNSSLVLPQSRDRLFFVGHLRNSGSRQVFPIEQICNQDNGIHRQGVIANTLTKRYYGSQSNGSYIIENKQPPDKSNIRRLTENECEALQGLPKDWTKYGIGDQGETIEISIEHRYGMCGNGVPVTLVELIAKKLYNLNYTT